MTDTDEWVPPHLRQLPQETVERLVGIVTSEFAGAMPYTLKMELEGFQRDRTAWDGRRVANALRYAYGRPGMAREIEAACDLAQGVAGVLGELKTGERGE